MLFGIHIHSPLRFIKNIHQQSCSFMCQPFQQCGMEISWSPGLKRLYSLGSHLRSGNFYLYNFTPLSHLALAVMVNTTGLQNFNTNQQKFWFLAMLGLCFLSLSLCTKPFFTHCSLCWVFFCVSVVFVCFQGWRIFCFLLSIFLPKSLSTSLVAVPFLFLFLLTSYLIWSFWRIFSFSLFRICTFNHWSISPNLHSQAF